MPEAANELIKQVHGKHEGMRKIITLETFLTHCTAEANQICRAEKMLLASARCGICASGRHRVLNVNEVRHRQVIRKIAYG